MEPRVNPKSWRTEVCWSVRLNPDSAVRIDAKSEKRAFRSEPMILCLSANIDHRWFDGNLKPTTNSVRKSKGKARLAPTPDSRLAHRDNVRSISQSGLNPGVPLVALIFPVTAFALADFFQARDKLEGADIFGVLVAELIFNP
jgi:hypothetical protein